MHTSDVFESRKSPKTIMMELNSLSQILLYVLSQCWSRQIFYIPFHNCTGQFGRSAGLLSCLATCCCYYLMEKYLTFSLRYGNINFLKLLLQPIHCNRDVFATAPSLPSSSFRVESAVPTSSPAATFRLTVYMGMQLPPYECSSLQLVQVYIVGSMFVETVGVLPDFCLKVDIAAVLTVYLERL